MLLNYFLTEPRYTWTIAEPDAAVTEFVLLAMAVAVAVLVDGAASRTREARRASQEAELLALFAGSVLRGADLATLLQRVRETYSQRAVTMLRVRQGASTGETVACVGTNPCRDVDSADTAIEVGDDEFWMLMAGRKLAARDRRVLTAVATQAAGLVKQRELAEEAGQAEAIARADELRRSLLSAVSHDLRTRWRRPRLRCPACAPKTSLSPRGYRRAVGHHRGVHRPTHRPGRKPARFVAVGCRRDSPQLRRAYLEEAVQRALVSIGKGATGFYRSGIDRVKVDVGDAVAMADAGLLERVLANLIDNALRYAPDCVVRVNAGRVRERVLINVIDEGPGSRAGPRSNSLPRSSGRGSRQHHRCRSGDVGGTRLRRGYGRHDFGYRYPGRRAHSGDRSGGSRGPPMTLVLVIDDEPQILRALRINLTVRGYQVITASTGAGALRAAAEHPPDVVILDLGLPDMSGIDVLGGLRGWLTAPVIVLSARTDSSDKVRPSMRAPTIT